ncbi:putative reverse transcriptase zinc-binding domain-containing protein [Helianthus annuus]|uniref:Reverse transcriptase zinc-binding domain-containing protein n=2 Tax=Helianthus annuus TaxID=4232 RepID=A0A9K3DUC7_HELAN|nr:putative reverse transcriptase zinc-binding domain-containing protein [Helianthus annuus]
MAFDFGSESGQFSLKSLRCLMEHKFFFSDLRIGYEWNGWVPIKVNFVAWRLVLNRLPTAVNLVQRNINIPDTRCKVCNEEDESASHLFVACNFAQKVWDFVVGWCRLGPLFYP